MVSQPVGPALHNLTAQRQPHSSSLQQRAGTEENEAIVLAAADSLSKASHKNQRMPAIADFVLETTDSESSEHH